MRYLLFHECSVVDSESPEASGVGAAGLAKPQREKEEHKHKVPGLCTSAAPAQRRRILGRRCAQTTSQESVRNFVSTSAWSRGETLQGACLSTASGITLSLIHI